MTKIEAAEAAGYIIYQANYAVFGTGATLEDAIADAREWADLPPGDEFAPPRGGNRDADGVMYWAPASAELMAAVREFGGDIGYWIDERGTAQIPPSWACRTA